MGKPEEAGGSKGKAMVSQGNQGKTRRSHSGPCKARGIQKGKPGEGPLVGIEPLWNPFEELSVVNVCLSIFGWFEGLPM